LARWLDQVALEQLALLCLEPMLTLEMLSGAQPLTLQAGRLGDHHSQ